MIAIFPLFGNGAGHKKKELDAYFHEVADFMPRWESNEAIVFGQFPENPHLDDDATKVSAIVPRWQSKMETRPEHAG